MKTLSSATDAQKLCQDWRSLGSVALVPTMGCLHAGHLALVERAKLLAPKVVVSIFVNPLQFGPKEDFARYPRTFQADADALAGAGVDLLFYPSPDDLYPQGFQTSVQVGALAKHLCGAFRPGHFDGVATVCLKLFQISACDIAVFGEKDFQQVRVIEQLSQDLNLPLRIERYPTVRENDGLALSSRNRYLSQAERTKALAISRALTTCATEVKLSPTVCVADLRNRVMTMLNAAEMAVEYVEIFPEQTLEPAAETARVCDILSPRMAIAARLGATRLIDNRTLAEISK